ncbi:MAG: hypothetical protein LBD75_07975 [Candidatus Peribacteria bacterium]|jgi:hypothetical protein|nr:hypothetical protein [Candidatus Peribacteria bacterium]
MEKKFTLLQRLIASVQTPDEKMFCKQKYLMYHLLEHSQKLFATPSLIEPAITPLPLPELTLSTQQHTAAPVTSETTKYLTLIHNTTSLTNKTALLLSQLAEKYLQAEIRKLIALGFLTTKDVQTLDEKIEINYVS